MSKITLEKVHASLERLIDYVMTEMPYIKRELDKKADKEDVQKIMDIMDGQSKNIETIRIEQVSMNRTLDRFEKRISRLEERNSGYQVRDNGIGE